MPIPDSSQDAAPQAGQVFATTHWSIVLAAGQRDLATQLSPVKLFDRRWALAVLVQAANRLRTGYVAEGRPELYERLKVFVSGASIDLSR